jgi:hypothetical protein
MKKTFWDGLIEWVVKLLTIVKIVKDPIEPPPSIKED